MAFAANSVLCRIALGQTAIDAASFTSIRLGSGAVTLLLIWTARRERGSRIPPNWLSAALLFSYAAAFSYAYINLETGTGALILFGTVQATMILGALRLNERMHASEWAGLIIVLGGLVYLVSPGLTAPDPGGSALMVTAGVSWGVYSLRGRRSSEPLADTTGNFIRSLPFVVVIGLATLPTAHTSPRGILLAVASGALASGLGYVVWYSALRGLTAVQAAIVQPSALVLAALGGIVFMAEVITLRLILSAVVILGGVALAIKGRR